MSRGPSRHAFWQPWRWSLLLTGLVLLGGCASDEPAGTESQPPTVAVFEVEYQEIETRRNWVGTLNPLQVLHVVAPEAGRVTDLKVQDGQRVERDQPLVRIDGTELSARHAVLRERREAVAEDLARWQRLAAADAAGSGEVEAARLRLLEVDEALAEVEQRMQATELSAPASGRVVGLSVREGSSSERGDLLLRIEPEDRLGLRLTVPASETRYFRDLERLRFDNGAELSAREVVTHQHDDLPRGFVAVDVVVSGEALDWPSELTLSYVATDNVLLVPWTAVARDEDRHWVAKLAGDPAEIRRTEVRTGRGRADGIEIIEGLSAGDRIVRHEPRAIGDGQTVQTRQDASE